ncbi:hypothetical protein BH09MYX1_BH09MYX1_11970 [soil metagenome]
MTDDRTTLEAQIAELMAENAKLRGEAKISALGEGLGEFSLEVRPPLNAILGYCELLLREEGARLTAHGRRDLGTIRTNTKTVLGLLGDLLDLSRMEAGQTDINVEDVHLGELVDEAIATTRGFLRGKEVDLTAEIGDEALHLRTDGHKLRRIIDKLLTNAAHTTEAGEILLSVHGEHDGTLALLVEDTGTGIAKDRLPHVFEKFRPRDGATAQERRASVDLAMVRETARILGGDATVESSLGRGSKFSVRLPNAISGVPGGPISARPPPLPREGDLAARRAVVFVDEDPLLLARLRGALSDDGFHFFESASPARGVQLARDHLPSAVVLDVHAPSLGGWGVLEELKTDPVLARLPIVLLSVDEARTKAFCFGACEFLSKPPDDTERVDVAAWALGGPNGNIGVVDGVPDSLSRTTRILEDAGFTVHPASEATSNVARLRSSKPALVVVDLAMPDGGGFEVLAALRAAGREIPVIALSPRRLSDDDLAVLRSGFDHVVKKSGKALDATLHDAVALLRNTRLGQGRLPKLLYVEDSPQNRDIVRRYLKGLFYVLEAEDGEHGIERAKREQPDIILMDLSLPRIDGWEATKRLKALPPLARTPVIALSAHVGKDDRERARVAGCVDYLTKPIERAPLLKSLRRHLVAV